MQALATPNELYFWSSLFTPIWTAVCAILFCVITFITAAPYGKVTTSWSFILGPAVPAKVLRYFIAPGVNLSDCVDIV